MRHDLTVDEVRAAMEKMPDPPEDMLRRAGLLGPVTGEAMTDIRIRRTAYLDEGWVFGYEDDEDQVEIEWHPFPEEKDGVEYWVSRVVLEEAGFRIL